MSQKTVTVSVRRLVEFILRSGDIDTVSGAFGEMDAMQQGGLMHRKLQKEAGPSYRAEVSLKHTTEMDETLAITVEGRADGVITESEMAADESGELGLKEVVTIDEIKCMYTDVTRFEKFKVYHRACVCSSGTGKVLCLFLCGKRGFRGNTGPDDVCAFEDGKSSAF